MLNEVQPFQEKGILQELWVANTVSSNIDDMPKLHKPNDRILVLGPLYIIATW